jgi:hypothetical protein
MKADIDLYQIASICQNVLVFFGHGRCCAGGEIPWLGACCMKAIVLRDEAMSCTAVAWSVLLRSLGATPPINSFHPDGTRREALTFSLFFAIIFGKLT